VAEVETTQCKGGWLDATTFKTVIASTPLVSIDLLVKNPQGEYLFGLRKNRPAQGYWFVPGGRIQKNESLDAAFRRLTHEELGLALERGAARFKGVYEHFYKDSIFGEDAPTHYVVLAYEVTLPADSVILDSQQHSDVLWIKPAELSQYATHLNSQIYF
jgi:colanic acid biosynthesis protein WcaH